jgi:hypothetical protein
MHLIEVKYVPADLMNYTLPYVVSFMSIEYQDTGKFIGLIIFLGWMFWITFRAGQIILNPLLIAFGWRLYDIKYRYAGSQNLYSGFALVKDAGKLVRASAGPGTCRRLALTRRPIELLALLLVLSKTAQRNAS